MRSRPSPAAACIDENDRVLRPLQIEFHPAMRDTGLVEHPAYRFEARLQIKAFGVELRVQDRAPVAERARLLKHEIEEAAADTPPAPFALDRHPVNARLCRDYGFPSVEADAAELPFASERFAVVILANMLEHVEDSHAVLS